MAFGGPSTARGLTRRRMQHTLHSYFNMSHGLPNVRSTSRSNTTWKTSEKGFNDPGRSSPPRARHGGDRRVRPQFFQGRPKGVRRADREGHGLRGRGQTPRQEKEANPQPVVLPVRGE